MLSINKFATLADTTRRTLLFYDEKDLFKPASVGKNGYRYYDYNQLYSLKFILQLRKLGLSVAEIKQLMASQDPTSLDGRLAQVLADIEQKIQDMTLLKATLLERYHQPADATDLPNNSPCIMHRPAQKFWTSLESVGCTDEAISNLYQQFYALIDPLKLVNKQESGFLTDLAASDARAYPEANFRIIKAISDSTVDSVPIITRPQGNYVAVSTQNNQESIEKGLDAIKQFITHNHLEIANNFWQLNASEQFTDKATSNRISIEYQLI